MGLRSAWFRTRLLMPSVCLVSLHRKNTATAALAAKHSAAKVHVMRPVQPTVPVSSPTCHVWSPYAERCSSRSPADFGEPPSMVPQLPTTAIRPAGHAGTAMAVHMPHGSGTVAIAMPVPMLPPAALPTAALPGGAKPGRPSSASSHVASGNGTPRRMPMLPRAHCSR